MQLEKYRRQDEGKIKELTIQLERLSKELQQRKKDLADEVTETQVRSKHVQQCL